MPTTVASALGCAWGRLPISDVEDLHDAVLGAGLEVVQMSRAPMTGSLAFAQDEHITYSSGLIDGHIGLTGPLSETKVTLGIGLRMAPGSSHWLNEVESRNVGVFMPGDVHEAFYTPGTLYAATTLSFERLEEIAAGMGLVLDRKQLGGSGISERCMSRQRIDGLRQGFEQVHGRRKVVPADTETLGQRTLYALIEHLARDPRLDLGASTARRHGLVVKRARSYIAGHLKEPLSIDTIARAALTSQRTLHRAFLDVLGETPQSYVRKLRLNRIRGELAEEAEARCTITIIANRWGISELGRLSGWYRELFGELPSQTRARLGSQTNPNGPPDWQDEHVILAESA